MKDAIVIPVLPTGTYRHNKSGNLYEVVAVALDTVQDLPTVIYRPLYEHEFGYELFTRSYEAFVELVVLRGKKMPRFELVDA